MSRLVLSLIAGLTTIGLLLAANPAFAQKQSRKFAEAYAPMYWFAIDEPLYPTLPHPFAFDGVALRTSTAPCRLELDNRGKPDFFNATELSLDETCDRVALKRRFRPLIQGSSQGANDEPGPHPRMRILFDGPRYFSGGLNITKFSGIVCGSAAPNRLIARLRSFLAVPEHEAGAPADKTHIVSLKDIKADAASGLCRGTFTNQELGVGRLPEDPIRKFRVRPAWHDTCRNIFVLKSPVRGCKGNVELMVFSGNRTLDEEVGAVLKPRYLIQYWAYFPYDRGIGGHRHDGEHVFVFLEGAHDRVLSLEAPVVAIVGGGHEEDAANNILLAGSLDANAAVVDQINFPEKLPRHAMVLVELGKHASAPDRNLNGRFDLGVDANLWGENAWGSRDTQSALFGKAQIGKMQPWYSMPRSSDGIFTEQSAWVPEVGQTSLDLKRYGVGYPSGLFAEFAAKVNAEVPQATASPASSCDFGGDRRYRLMPIPVLRGLTNKIRSGRSDAQTGWESVWQFLDANKKEFWEEGCDTGLPASADPALGRDVMAALQGWLDTETEKRDVWLHRKFVNPDSVFKTHLFPRMSLGWGLRSFSGARQQVWVAQIADLLKTRMLHDSTLELAGRNPVRHLALTVENFRGRYRGWYTGFSTDSDKETHRRWNFRAGYEIQFATLETIPGLGSAFKALKPLSPLWQRTRASIRLGGRGLLWGGGVLGDRQPANVYQNFAFEWSLNLVVGVRQSKHPLKFFADVGSHPKEGERQ